MDIPYQIENQICVIIPEGELALEMVSQFKEFIKPHLGDPEIFGIAIELTKVAFIDSSGLGLILTVAKTLEERDALLVLYGANENLYKIFTDTRLHTYLHLHKTKEEALIKFTEKKS